MKPDFCLSKKTKALISSAVTAQLIGVFVFATQILQSLFFLNPKFQAASLLSSPIKNRKSYCSHVGVGVAQNVKVFG